MHRFIFQASHLLHNVLISNFVQTSLEYFTTITMLTTTSPSHITICEPLEMLLGSPKKFKTGSYNTYILFISFPFSFICIQMADKKIFQKQFSLPKFLNKVVTNIFLSFCPQEKERKKEKQHTREISYIVFLFNLFIETSSFFLPNK